MCQSVNWRLARKDQSIPQASKHKLYRRTSDVKLVKYGKGGAVTAMNMLMF